MGPSEFKIIVDVILSAQEKILKQIAIIDRKMEELEAKEANKNKPGPKKKKSVDSKDNMV